MIPFGFGQENGITEKTQAFIKIILLLGLLSGFTAVMSLLDNRVKEIKVITGQEQVGWVCTDLYLMSECGIRALVCWSHFCCLG